MGQSAQNLFQTPEQVGAERLKRQQSMFASAQSPYERMGLAIGNILGGALGVKDAAMERASTTQSIYNSVLQSNPDTTSSSFYTELANTLAAAGLGAEANYALEEGRKYTKEEREFGLKERQVAAAEKTARGKDDVLSVLTKDGRPAVYDSETNSFKVPDKETGQLRAFDPTKDQLEYKQSAGDPLSALIAAIVAQSMGMGGLGGKQPGAPKPSTSPKSDSKPKPTTPLDPNAYKM